jgi:hypothetical protein
MGKVRALVQYRPAPDKFTESSTKHQQLFAHARQQQQQQQQQQQPQRELHTAGSGQPDTM